PPGQPRRRPDGHEPGQGDQAHPRGRSLLARLRPPPARRRGPARQGRQGGKRLLPPGDRRVRRLPPASARPFLGLFQLAPLPPPPHPTTHPPPPPPHPP